LAGTALTTLSDCDLAKGTRHVVSFPNNAISSTERAGFDHFLDQHPLVQFHSLWSNQRARRISDCLPISRFRRTDLYNEYYRRVGIGHVVALPLIAGRHRIVSFVLKCTAVAVKRDYARFMESKKWRAGRGWRSLVWVGPPGLRTASGKLNAPRSQLSATTHASWSRRSGGPDAVGEAWCG
jgi:hypothetical protein